jgi:undecaprenyl-diphosphatase
MVHAATVCSTIVAFRKEIWNLLCGFFSMKMNPQKEYVFKIAVSMIPIFVVGVFFKEQVEAIFGSGLLVVGCMLLLTAGLLTLSEYLSNKYNGEGHAVTYKDAIIIGLGQALAVLPGLSRSGTTISTGLMLGVRKSDVAQFSFLMVLVPILGEAFLELVGGELSGVESGIPALSLALGFVAAFLSGLFACKLMINIVNKAKLWVFALYCVIVGVACIVSGLI